MKNEFDRNKDLNKWATREHEIELHERIQRWGEAVLPLLSEEGADDLPARMQLFEFLMTSVERGDYDIATLIPEHERAVIESTRSWYTDELGSISKKDIDTRIRNRFLTWLKIFHANQ